MIATKGLSQASAPLGYTTPTNIDISSKLCPLQRVGPDKKLESRRHWIMDKVGEMIAKPSESVEKEHR
ncbi:hypothetical protein K1719_008378 [Acacia pycnantha]|nr:hypothetical protein K1719_008378 [Acacia pycnantha]